MEDLPQKSKATHSSTLDWRIPWTVDLVGYSPQGHKELDMTEVTEHVHMLLQTEFRSIASASIFQKRPEFIFYF